MHTRVYLRVFVHACARVYLNCSGKTEPQLGYFNIPFSCTVKTMNSYATVSISRLNNVERMKKLHIFSGIFI